MAQQPGSSNNGRVGGVHPWLFNGLAILVALVWAVSFIVDALSDKYEPPVAIHGAMMVVLGAVFGVQLVKR